MGGISFFLANAAIVKAAGVYIPIIITEQAKIAKNYMVEVMKKKNTPGGDGITVSLYENQRW